MADITYGVNVQVSKGLLNSSLIANSVTAAMGLAGLKSDTYTLSTATVAISTANLGTVGLAFVRNLSTATQATVAIAVVSGANVANFCTLRPGEPAVFRLTSGQEYRASSVTGADARLRVDITEG